MDEGSAPATLPRILPPLTDLDRPFWTAGSAGQLVIQRCASCRRWVHPPTEQCPACQGELAPEPVSGCGTVFTFTVNMHQYNPSVPAPYIIALVELDEQPDLRLPTNIVNCEIEAVRCGMPVQVLFEQHGNVFVPVFEPASTPG
jgi:uncharacterized OB-fold protein